MGKMGQKGECCGRGYWKVAVGDHKLQINKQSMKKLKTSSAGSQKTIHISGCSTQIGIQTDQKLVQEDQVYGGSGMPERSNKFYRKSNRYELLRKEHSNYKETLMGQLLEELLTRRKRYSFQMIKLKYMFPDDSFSENMSVNSYDRLFYTDEHIHTIVKIYETKETEAKIWAFINLMNLHKKKKLQKFTAKIEKVKHRLIGTEFKNSFDLINQFSIKIKAESQTQLEPSKVIIQRKQAIQTRVQHPRPPSQPIKTQRVNTTSTNTTSTNAKTISSTTDTNQIIRVPALESFPQAKRVELSSESGVRFYPTSIPQTIRTTANSSDETKVKNTYEVREVRDTRDIARTQIISPSFEKNESRVRYVNESDTKTVYPARTHFSSQKRVQLTRPSTVHEVQSIRNFETIPINTSAMYYSRPMQVREIQEVEEVNRNYYYGKEALVHTVRGDCTINIHNYCDHPRGTFRDRADVIQQRNGSVTSRRHARSNSRQAQNYESYRIQQSSNRPRVLDGYSQHYQGNYLRGSHCSVHNCQPVCSCMYHGCNQYHSHMRGSYNPSDPYSIEERIQYMNHLEHISKPNFTYYAKNGN